jgi:hypothetical protein
VGFIHHRQTISNHTLNSARESGNPREDERSESERLASDVRSRTVYGRPEAAYHLPTCPHRSRTPRRRSRSHHRIKTPTAGTQSSPDMVAKKAGRTFLISSWRDDQAVCLRRSCLHRLPRLLDNRRMRNVVYVLPET